MPPARGYGRDVRLCGALSRRMCLPLAGTAALSLLVPTPAWTQPSAWHTWRRDDLGFEVELPGEPKIETENDPEWQSVSAEVNIDGVLFGANWHHYKRRLSMEEISAAARKAAQALGVAVVAETQFTLDGFPGIEVATEAADFDFAYLTRIVLVKDRVIATQVIGGKLQAIGEDPAVRRFFASFKLLPDK